MAYEAAVKQHQAAQAELKKMEEERSAAQKLASELEVKIQQFNKQVQAYQQMKNLYDKYQFLKKNMPVIPEKPEPVKEERAGGTAASQTGHPGKSNCLRPESPGGIYAVFLITDMLNALSRYGILILDDLDKLDEFSFQALISLICQKEVSDGYSHIFFAAANYSDIIKTIKEKKKIATIDL